jgi:hypothetical protein
MSHDVCGKMLRVVCTPPPQWGCPLATPHAPAPSQIFAGINERQMTIDKIGLDRRIMMVRKTLLRSTVLKRKTASEERRLHALSSFCEQEAQCCSTMSSPLEEARRRHRLDLKRHGTDVDKNDRDPLGDGDQSRIALKAKHKNPLTDPNRQYHRNVWSEGGDIFECLKFDGFSDFARACTFGDVSGVERLLTEVDTDPARPSEALIQRLETRETCMRLSPILMMVSVTKTFQHDGPSLFANRVKVVNLLLKYGARPDARDVVGKVRRSTDTSLDRFAGTVFFLIACSVLLLTDCLPLRHGINVYKTHLGNWRTLH